MSVKRRWGFLFLQTMVSSGTKALEQNEAILPSRFLTGQGKSERQV
jgi:hypothetical protein